MISKCLLYIKQNYTAFTMKSSVYNKYEELKRKAVK